MRKLHLQTGGRPRSLDDLQILMDLTDESATALLKGRGAFIVSGCEVTGDAIAAGYIFADGEILEFAGNSGNVWPVYLHKATEIFDNTLTYEDASSKTTQRETFAEVVTSIPGSGEYITMSATGGRTYFDAINDKVVTLAGSQSISGVKTFINDIIVAGTSVVAQITNLLNNKADKTTAINSGTGLQGGGNLTTSRTLSLASGAAVANLGYTPAPKEIPFSTQAGSSYTLALGDSGALVRRTNASVNNVTIPLNSSVAFPLGTEILISREGAGAAAILPTGGVTIVSEGSKTNMGAQYTMVCLIKIATDTWLLAGNLA